MPAPPVQAQAEVYIVECHSEIDLVEPTDGCEPLALDHKTCGRDCSDILRKRVASKIALILWTQQPVRVRGSTGWFGVRGICSLY